MMNTPIYPVTDKMIKFQKKVDNWKTNLMDLVVSPFNNNLWSII